MNKLNGNDPLLAPLQGLRVLATLAIFLYHSGILIQGAFPVTFFFVLSGFLLYYNKHALNGYETFPKWLSYVWKKLKEFYPLHLITFVYAFIVLDCNATGTSLKAAVLNLLLLQSFSEETLYSFNSLAWYLSAVMFLYLIGFFLIKLLNRLQKFWKIMLVITLLLICACNLLLWFEIPVHLYGNPFYRILDFFLGMLLAHLFLNNKSSLLEGKKASVCEVSFCVMFVAMYVLSLFLKPKCGYYSAFFAAAIYLFAHGKGCISKVLGSKFFVSAAKYSFSFYMIHEVVLRTLRKLIPVDTMAYFSRVFLICAIAFPLTVVIALIVQTLQITIRNKKFR